MNPNKYVTKTGRNSLHRFLIYDIHTVFRTHRLTHSLTDAQTQTQNTSGTVNDGEVIKAAGSV